MDSQVPGSWTDEMHVDFLNTIEASFVRAMFGINVKKAHGAVLRLDRNFPDGFDSTRDLGKSKKHAVATTSPTARGGNMGPRNRLMSRRAERRRRRRRLSPQPFDSSNDQVVPEVETRIGDKDYPNNGPLVGHN